MRSMKLSKKNHHQHEVTFDQIHIFRKSNMLGKIKH